MQDVFISLRLYRIAFYAKYRRVKKKVNLCCTKSICFQNICKTEFMYNPYHSFLSALLYCQYLHKLLSKCLFVKPSLEFSSQGAHRVLGNYSLQCLEMRK